MTSRRHPTSESQTPSPQLPLDFESVLRSADVRSRDEVSAQLPAEDGPYDPVDQTARYMQRAVESEAKWETTLRKARDELLLTDAREVFFDFLCDLARQIERGAPNATHLIHLLETVALRGLGMSEGSGRHYLLSSRKGAQLGGG